MKKLLGNKKLALMGGGFLILLAGFSFFINGFKPTYEGRLALQGLSEGVVINYDEWGVPHIEGKTQEDIYLALGYVHAQDRLFQMEMIRRLTRGKLSEVFGKDLVKTDILFKTIDMLSIANQSIESMSGDKEKAYYKNTVAYLKGLNAFAQNGQRPIEFSLMGIPQPAFEMADLILVAGYMSFGFAEGFKTDPLLHKINKLPNAIDKLKDLNLEYDPKMTRIPNFNGDKLSLDLAQALDKLPVALLEGSNSWILGPRKTKSGKILFSNDTHIGFSQPSVWYEAHLKAPGYEVFGKFLAGFPFAPIGHNEKISLGITMLENDDVDFYIQKTSESMPGKALVKGQWEKVISIDDSIKVKDGEMHPFTRKYTSIGPVLSGVMEALPDHKDLISVFWTFREFPSRLLEAAYSFSTATSLKEVESQLSLISSPGLNIMVGDHSGNIGWIAAGKIRKRLNNQDSYYFIEADSLSDADFEFRDFSENPRCINPPEGFVYSANNLPDTLNGVSLPGYYCAESRAKRIVELLSDKDDWEMEDIQKMIFEDKLVHAEEDVKILVGGLDNSDLTEFQQKVRGELQNWKGTHGAEEAGPVIYYKMMSHLVFSAFGDELSEEEMGVFLGTHLLKRSVPELLRNPGSKWWDKKGTESQEGLDDLLKGAFLISCKELKNQLGNNPSDWKWGDVHQLTHKHPFGQSPLMARIFNVGPHRASGGNGVINNMGFKYDLDGEYEVLFGPAMRTIVDFANPLVSYSVIPTGQSGNLLSDNYENQSQMYITGKFKKQLLDKEEIKKHGKSTLELFPVP